jgi:spoIIIJ-associated protein
MEWVETTARTREEATELALDQLGVVLEEAEVVVLEEPRQGLFGRMRGEARVRARVRPAPVRPKQDRRRGSRNRQATDRRPRAEESAPAGAEEAPAADSPSGGRRRRGARGRGRQGAAASTVTEVPAANDAGDAEPESPVPVRSPSPEGVAMTTDVPAADDAEPTVTVDEVRDAAVQFVTGLTDAFGFDAAVGARIDGSEIEVEVAGESLGLLIGPGGRTLLGIQDLARVAAQRRLGDHDTRLRVDVAGYREKRRQALERFAATVAEQVKTTGVARSLDPMPSADRKVLHDALAEIDGVVSRSEGEEPNRRVIVAPE